MTFLHLKFIKNGYYLIYSKYSEKRSLLLNVSCYIYVTPFLSSEPFVKFVDITAKVVRNHWKKLCE